MLWSLLATKRTRRSEPAFCGNDGESYRIRAQLIDKPRFREGIGLEFPQKKVGFRSVQLGFPSAWAWFSFTPVWISFSPAWNSFRAGWEGRPRRRLFGPGGSEATASRAASRPAVRLGSYANALMQTSPTNH